MSARGHRYYVTRLCHTPRVAEFGCAHPRAGIMRILGLAHNHPGDAPARRHHTLYGIRDAAVRYEWFAMS